MASTSSTIKEVSTGIVGFTSADKFPEICGSGTLAMEVSSTSIKVDSVTVSAITQVLIFPSGVRNLAKILFNMAAFPVFAPYCYYAGTLCFIPPAFPFDRLLFGDDRGVHVHSRP